MLKVDGVELRRVSMPLKGPFETSFGVQYERDLILVRVLTAGGEGWGECVAMAAPTYSSEFNDAVMLVMRDFLLPLLARPSGIDAAGFTEAAAPVKGHRMAKAAVEMALLDAQLRQSGLSFAEYLGATRSHVPAGVSVGIAPDIDSLLRTVGVFIEQGYVRIKLKIKPGWDLEPVRQVRREFGDDLLLQVDANAAYALSDARLLSRLDEFGLLLIEQPLGEEDLTEHAALARILQTPICLDESITSAKAAADALRLGACSVVNIKAGRVGGYLEARRIHDVCAAQGVPVWCGGMIETGIGRAANMALAALPGFTLPGDTSASDRFYEQDITEPLVIQDGQIEVPTGPGTGIAIRHEVLSQVTRSTEWISLTGG